MQLLRNAAARCFRDGGLIGYRVTGARAAEPRSSNTITQRGALLESGLLTVLGRCDFGSRQCLYVRVPQRKQRHWTNCIQKLAELLAAMMRLSETFGARSSTRGTFYRRCPPRGVVAAGLGRCRSIAKVLISPSSSAGYRLVRGWGGGACTPHARRKVDVSGRRARPALCARTSWIKRSDRGTERDAEDDGVLALTLLGLEVGFCGMEPAPEVVNAVMENGGRRSPPPRR